MNEVDLKKCVPVETAAEIVKILMKYVNKPSSKSESKPNSKLWSKRKNGTKSTGSFMKCFFSFYPERCKNQKNKTKYCTYQSNFYLMIGYLSNNKSTKFLFHSNIS